MRVAFDTSPLKLTQAGTARYVRNLLARIRSEVDVEELALGGSGRASVLARELGWYPFVLPRRARGSDILHCPTYYGPFGSETPLVVTVHDLAVFRHPETFPRWTRIYVPRAVPRVLRAASRVIAVSEFTKRELCELLGVPGAKIRVVPNGVEEVFRPDGDRHDGQYVLAVGTLEPRKNLTRVVEAVRRLDDLGLHVIGARGWGKVALDGWIGRVSDEELARQYRGASCVVYSSFYEGFGIPIVEAMACGAPVVTSRGGATEEVAGGAAVLVDPFDVDSIAAGIREAVSRREELRARGLQRARAFSWDATADATLDVYRELT